MFPRVILSDEADVYKTMNIKKDKDGIFFIDYLNIDKKDNDILIHNESIESRLTTYMCNNKIIDMKIFGNYAWMLAYQNTVDQNTDKLSDELYQKALASLICKYKDSF